MTTDTHRITQRKIDELLDYLSLFEQPRTSWVKAVHGGARQEGVVSIPFPEYADEVVEFFMRAGQTCFSDYQYEPREAARMLADDDVIAAADLAAIKTMLTYCVRGERFSDGHWDRMLTTGRITALLRRLRALRETVAP